MINRILKKLFRSGVFFSVIVFAQDIPIPEPHLIPFPSISMGGSYLSLVPKQNLTLSNTAGGWTPASELSGIATTLDIEWLRYRWGHWLLSNPRMDIHSGLGYRIFSQLGEFDLPAAYPSSLLLNNFLVEDLSMSAQVKEIYLSHAFVYKYSHRGSLQANLATGLAHLNLYKNADGIRLLETNGFGLHVGLGWKYHLFGRPGKRLLLGLDVGYSIRSFDLAAGDESLALPNGSPDGVSPVRAIALNTPDVRINIDLGEMLFGAYTPYRDPYRLGLLSMSIGYGLMSFHEGESIHYDSAGVSLSIPAAGKITRNIDIQFFKYNWPFHFLRQSNIDILSGVGFRQWKTSKRSQLPTGWATTLTDGTREFAGLQFAPRVLDIYLNHELIYPLGPKLHLKTTVGTGLASLTLYENAGLERLIDATSFSWQWGTAVGYTARGDGGSKVSIGAGVHYYHQAFDIDMGSSNLSPVTVSERIPISHINLSQPIFSVDIGLIFGGSPNAAQRAYTAFKEKRFSRALEIQTELLTLFPDHHNRDALNIQKAMLEDSLVTRYYKDVRTILNKGDLESAYAFISRGEKAPSPAVGEAVEEMRWEISEAALAKAKQALDDLDPEQGEKHILLALKSDPSCLPVAKALLSRSYIIRATILYQSEVYNRSLYWLKVAEGMSPRYHLVIANLRQKIGDGRLDDANEGILHEDRQMALESMQAAKKLNPDLGDIVDPHLVDLQKAIDHIEEQTIGPMKRMALDNLLDDIEGLSPENFRPQIGMKASLIARYVGPPERKFEEGEYELWVYPKSEFLEIWLYLKEGLIEKIEYKNLD